MTGSKRALAVFAASALFAPLVSFGNPAYAVGEATPPAPLDVSEVCQNVPADFDPFIDIEGNFFEENIECLAFAEITQGLSGGNRYGPGFRVTRGQMASFIARLIDTANAEEPEGQNQLRDLPAFDGQDSFIDVQEGFVHRPAIDRLDEAGIVQGGPGGRPSNIYGPELDVTRAQMASFIKRALEFMTADNFDTTQDFFTDDENAQPHEPNINAVAALGIAVGDGNNSFDPFRPIPRDQMSAFLTRTLAFLFNEGFITPIGQDQATEPTIVVESQNVQPGDPIVISIDGQDIDSVTVTGECIVDETDATATGRDNTQTFDGNGTQDTIDVSVQTREDFAGDQCTITVTVNDANGQFSDTINVNFDQTGQQPGPVTGVTDAPDLISAQFVSTNDTDTTAGNNNSQSVVRFVFDETVVASGIDAADFRIVRADGSFVTGDSAQRDPDNTSAVLVTFNEDGASTSDTNDGFNSANIGDFTLATVDNDAVVDVDGNGNPIGDAPLGEGTTGNAAGVTDAPDLQSITNFRASESNTLVDFVFDENAFVINGGQGQFQLILTNGDDVLGSAVVNGTTTDTNDFVGDGTTTITVSFPFTESGGNLVTADEVVRGIVLENTVSDADPFTATGTQNTTTGATNPLQATETPDGASSSPDLVSVTFTESTSSSTATFTFDQNVVLNGDGTDFAIFNAQGVETVGAAGAASQETTPDNTIVVVFPNAAIEAAVGGNVDEAAVRGAAATGQFNQEDEEGAVSSSGTAAGRTDGPDLIAVDSQDTTTTSGGTTRTTSVSFTFTFDEAVFDVNGSPTTTDFFAVQPDGDMIALENCQANAFNGSTAEAEENTVTCTVDDTPGNTVNETDDVVDAVGGAVERGAVEDNLGNENPRGFEAIA